MKRPFWRSPYLVVIAGRPNVGKSTLFNTIVGRWVAIVDPTPGVTRDRIVRPVAWGGKRFDLMDTGGIGIVDMQRLEELVELQIQSGLGMADLILFVTDVKAGVTPLDQAVAEALRKSGKPVVLVVNKCDAPKYDIEAEEFRKLGFDEMFVISAAERRGLDELMQRVARDAPGEGEEEDGEGLKLALVGRRNVGKSSFVNALAGEERVIVSDVPGTTRDAVDVSVETPKLKLVAIDTAGVRKKSSIRHPVEFYSTCRTETAVRRSDVVVLMIDAVQGVSNIEKRLAQMVSEEHKPCVIAVNKWDLAGELDPDKYTDYIARTLPGLSFCPIVYLSALKGERVKAVVKVAADLFEQAKREWNTGLVNRIVTEAVERQPPRAKGKRRPKIYYVTQLPGPPPTFLLFVNEPELFDASYRRFLASHMRKKLKAPEVPMRLIFRRRRREKS